MAEDHASIKAAPTHTETMGKRHSLEHTLTNEIHGFQADFSTLPKGYYRSPFFLGTYLATGLAIMCGTGAFGFAAPILGVINADIGPDSRYVWISLVYNAVLAVFLSPIGRLSDIFGRRYFFVGGALVAIVGSVVCATAKDIPTLVNITSNIHRTCMLTTRRLVEMFSLRRLRKSFHPYFTSLTTY